MTKPSQVQGKKVQDGGRKDTDLQETEPRRQEVEQLQEDTPLYRQLGKTSQSICSNVLATWEILG